MTRFCKDCDYCVAGLPPLNTSYWFKCAHPEAGDPDSLNQVSGERLGGDYCDFNRKYGACGTEGKYFEPKQSNVIPFDREAV